MKLIVYPDREALAVGLAGAIISELSAALQADGRASLSVPGGTTPGPVFDLLSEAAIDWPHVAVFLNDERWVDEGSARSNTRLLRERLLHGAAGAARLVPLFAPGATPEDRLAELSAGIAPHLPITVLLLGMGLDMHTASLFPGADRLADALAGNAPILLAMRAEAAGEPRVTLTAPVLAGAAHIHMMITGAQKRAAIECAATLSPQDAPVRVVLDNATVHWAE